MTTFTIRPWRDYHGDPICFSVFTDDGYEADRCVSEQEAEFACAYLEAHAEDAQREAAE